MKMFLWLPERFLREREESPLRLGCAPETGLPLCRSIQTIITTSNQYYFGSSGVGYLASKETDSIDG